MAKIQLRSYVFLWMNFRRSTIKNFWIFIVVSDFQHRWKNIELEMTSHKLSSGVMIYDASPLLMFILNKKDLNIQNMTIFILLVIILVDHFSMSITTILGKIKDFLVWKVFKIEIFRNCPKKFLVQKSVELFHKSLCWSRKNYE